MRDGFLLWEKTILAAAFILPQRAMRKCDTAINAELLPAHMIDPRAS